MILRVKLHFILLFLLQTGILPALNTLAQNIEITGETIEISINKYKAGNIQWQFSNDNKNWVNILGATSDNLKYKIIDSGLIRAKITYGSCTYFTTEQFIYAKPRDKALICTDEGANIKLSWNLNLDPALIKNYIININDTLIHIDAKSNSLLLPRKFNYYHKVFSIKATMYDNTETPTFNTIYENNYTKLFSNSNKYISHRGLSAKYPENTAIAFEKAAEAGFKYAECDILLSKDKQWVICHDETIDRTSDGSGKISDLTLYELQKFNFGYPKIFGSSYTQKIMSLNEFISLCKKNNLIPFIEIKQGGNKQDYINLINIIKESFDYQDFVIFSFGLSILKEIRSIDKDVILGLSTSSEIDLTIITSLYPCFNCMAFNLIQNEIKNNSTFKPFVSQYLNNGIYIVLWTINDSKFFDLLKKYNFFILTDVVPQNLNN